MFKNYANLTDEQRDEIVKVYNQWVQMDGITVGQAISCAAKDVFKLTIKQWNAKIGSNAFAAVCGVLIMKKALKIEATINGKT